MTFLNEGTWDRALRVVVGIALIAWAWFLGFNIPGTAVFIIGVIAFATGVAGWCPAYSVFHVSTAGKPR